MEEITRAQLAADFAYRFMFHWHRGVIECEAGTQYILFGNEGHKPEYVESLIAKLPEGDVEVHCGDYTWAIVLTDYRHRCLSETQLQLLLTSEWRAAVENRKAQSDEGQMDETTDVARKDERPA